MLLALCHVHLSMMFNIEDENESWAVGYDFEFELRTS
ncbi:hypothetical protein SM0020_11980 [Sinorhizobium meliloti CCNWSX0020]|uniref:Uncharacterized protein n=1 Tax=Sinorhizobium meliloti CCNWSX0020 TaxID=1107881 RepID=H0FYU2_RHIML|nr:hypothetical protein SM0020_11980 [Sinorhizobium meliloti CCNWSX0020]PII38197.1 hypothetical protein T190_25395 [Sinorhizobium meliloti CCBAU 01290]